MSKVYYQNKNYLFFKIIIAVLFVAVLFGQFIRLEVGAQASGGLLLADLVVIPLAVWTLIETVWKRDVQWPWTGGIKVNIQWQNPVIWLVFWLGIALLSWLVNVHFYTPKQDLIGLAYLVRVTSYILVGLWVKRQYIILSSHDKEAQMQSDLTRYLGFTAIVSLLIGGLILYIMPDFAALAAMGWDPHVGRLTSTWLDPNYYGSFLALVFAFFLTQLARIRKEYGRLTKRQWPYFAVLLLSWIGIYLTYSRSALVTFVISGLAVAIFLSWRYVLLIILMLSTIIAMPSRLQARLGDTVAFSVQQVTTSGQTTATSADPTANDRVNSWKRAYQLFKTSPVIGVGYNMYGYALEKHGILSAQTIDTNRASSGSDSSLMTVLATTGIAGLLVFLMFWLMLLRRLFINRKASYLTIGALGWSVGWAASSMLNNTLFYALLMLPSVLVLCLTYVSVLNHEK